MKTCRFVCFVLCALFLSNCVPDHNPTDEKTPTLPTVKSTIPEDGAVDVALDGTVTVTFSESILPETVSTGSIAMMDSDNNVLAGEIALSSKNSVATFTPTASLVEGRSYVVKIFRTIQDVNGLPLDVDGVDKPYTFSFSTVSTSPSVVSVAPAADTSVSAATTTAVTVTFSEDLDAETVHEGSIMVVDIDGVVSWDSEAKTATLTFSETLAPNRTYTVIVTTEIEDAAGIPLDKETISSFSTTE